LHLSVIDIQDKPPHRPHWTLQPTDRNSHNPKDQEYLSHDLYSDVLHSFGWPDLDILFQALKKVFQAAKQIHKSVLASADIPNGLKVNGVTRTHAPG
jgi:hypothetical protein